MAAAALSSGALLRLYAGLEAALPDARRRIVQFASAYDGEGAHLIAHELATTVSTQLAKPVLFIDTQSELAHSMAPAAMHNRATLADVIANRATLGDALYSVENSRMAYAFFGAAQQGAVLAQPEQLRQLLAHLCDAFDMIVIPTPAVLRDIFGQAIARFTDGIVLVVEAERTREPVAQQVKDILGANGKLIGAVMHNRRFYIPRRFYGLIYDSSSLQNGWKLVPKLLWRRSRRLFHSLKARAHARSTRQ